jgi:hypothetical protein
VEQPRGPGTRKIATVARERGSLAVIGALLGAGGLRPPVAPGGSGALAAPRPVVTWAVADLTVTPSGAATVGLEVVIENPQAWATASTSILWEPDFAGSFTLVDSEPPPWRVRIDERGRGVLDTNGLLPQRSGTFRLRFAGPGAAPEGGQPPLVAGFRTPRLVVVADGAQTIAETAGEVRLATPPAGRWLPVFERGPLARIADLVPPATAHPRHGFGLAVGMAALLGLVTGAGAAASLRSASAAERPDPRRAEATRRQIADRSDR